MMRWKLDKKPTRLILINYGDYSCFPVEAVEFGWFQGGHHYFKSCCLIKLKGNMQRWHQQNWETDSLFHFTILPN